MTVGAASVDPGTYAALASVAAITTAILAVVALIPFSDSRTVKARLTDVKQGQPGHAEIVDGAHRRAFQSCLLVLPVVVVNVAVLVAWWDVGLSRAPWRLWLPCTAVALLVAYLACISVVGIVMMRRAS